MIKRILLTFGLMMPVLIVAIPNSAAAIDPLNHVCSTNPDDPSYVPPTNSTLCKSNHTTGENPLIGPNGILTKAIQIIAIIVGIAAVFTFIISGMRMLLSGGDSQRVAAARSGITFAIVGIVVALLSQAIVTFVLNKLK